MGAKFVSAAGMDPGRSCRRNTRDAMGRGGRGGEEEGEEARASTLLFPTLPNM